MTQKNYPRETSDSAATKERPTRSESFSGQLRQALRHLKDPTWLGITSPLGAPYFLGPYLLAQTDLPIEQPVGRGQAVQRLLQAAIEAVGAAGGTGEVDYQRLLRLTYVEAKAVSFVSHELGLSQATYYRRRKEALDYGRGAHSPLDALIAAGATAPSPTPHRV